MSVTTQSTEPTTKKCEATDFIIPVVTVLTIAITATAIGILMSPVAIPAALVPITFYLAATGTVKSAALIALTISQLTGSKFTTTRNLGILTGVFLTVSAIALGILLAPIGLPGAITSLGIILIFGGVIGSVTFGGMTINKALGFS